MELMKTFIMVVVIEIVIAIVLMKIIIKTKLNSNVIGRLLGVCMIVIATILQIFTPTADSAIGFMGSDIFYTIIANILCTVGGSIIIDVLKKS